MGDLQFDILVEHSKAIAALAKVVEAQTRAEQAGRQIGEEGRKSQSAWERFGRASGRELMGMVTGLVSVSAAVGGIKTIWEKVVAEITKAHGAQMKLGEGSYELGAAVKRIRAHTGYRGTEEQSEAQLRAVYAAGKFMDVQKAADFTIAGETAFRPLGEQQAQGLTVQAARFLQTFGGQEAGEEFLELAGRTGVKTKEQMDILGGQMMTGYRQARYRDPAEYIRSVGRLLPEYKAAGASLPQVMATLSQARAASESGEEAESLAEQNLRLLEDKKLQTAAAKRAGLSRRQYLAQPFARRQEQMGEYVSAELQTEAGQIRLGEKIDRRRIVPTRTMYKEGGGAAYAVAAEPLEQIGPAEVQATAAEAEAGAFEPREAVRSEAALLNRTASRRIEIGEDLLLRSGAIVTQLQAGQEVEEFATETGKPPRREIWAAEEGRGKQMAVARQLLRQKWEKQWEGPLERGEIVGQDLERYRRGLVLTSPAALSTGWMPGSAPSTAGDLGKVVESLDALAGYMSETAKNTRGGLAPPPASPHAMP